MQPSAVVEKRGGRVAEAELSCSVREENAARKESYAADWHSVRMRMRPEDRQSLAMNDDERRESLTRHWEARPLSQSCPSGVVRMGTMEVGIREHQLLPHRNTLPLPIFRPAELGTRLGRGAPHTLEDLSPAQSPSGACPNKRAISEIMKDLPPVKPMRMEFAKSPRTLGRSVSQEAQRG
ncbi:telethonin [Denticeps clupeoides]|uniref:Telethonin n=1 Tax=Denticeps clupeoides TaxID=299321 RepID=A0AAY4AW26_9TELE|nr:telethonin [Denticeps clupeoides]